LTPVFPLAELAVAGRNRNPTEDLLAC